MSITVSTELDAVLDGIEQTVDVRVTLDLPVGPYADLSQAVRSLSLSMQNGTDLPSEVRDVVGFAAMSGDIVLAGCVDPAGDDTKTVAWLLNPDSTTSPLYRTTIKRCPVTVDLGYQVPGSVEPEWVRKFTGSVAGYSIDHDEGSATLNVTDRSIDYDNTPDIPAVIVTSPYNSGLTSAFPMDAIIRTSGRASTWPATRPGAVLAVGMCSSIWPEVGTLSSAGQPYPAFAPGAYGPALAGTTANDVSGLGETIYALPPFTGSDIFVEALVTGCDVGAASVSYDFGIRGAGTVTGVTLLADSSGLRLFVNGGQRGSVPVTLDGGAHYIAAHLTYGPGAQPAVTGTLRVDGATSAVSIAQGDSANVAQLTSVNAAGIAADGGATIAGVQITTETAPASNYPFAPAAILDTSLNPLTVVPEIPAGSSGSDQLQTIAAAELGYARFDEQGVFRFTNRETIASSDDVRTLTADDAIKTGMTTEVGASTEYDHVQVPFTEWNFGAPDAVFVLDSVKAIPAHGKLAWTQPLANLAANIDPTAALLADSHDPTDGHSWFRASADPAGATAHPGVSVDIRQVSAGTVTITVTNHTGQAAYLTTPATYTDFTAGSTGSGLWIGGTPVTPADEAFTDSVYGDGAKPPLTLSSNAYQQKQSAAQAVGDYLLPQVSYSIRDFTGVAIIPDPRRQIPDKVHLVDPVRSLIDEFAQLWGWQLNIDFPEPGQSGGAWDMSLDVRALGPPGAWLLDIPGRSELGDSTPGNPGTAYAY